jgi:hypothetical protein
MASKTSYHYDMFINAAVAMIENCCRAIMRRGHTMSGALNGYVANEKGMMPNA